MNLTIKLIRFYQMLLAPWARLLGAQCRFHPSCSNYALMAFSQFVWWKAFCLTLRRLLRCHPGHPGGFDPIPQEAISEVNPR